MDADNLASGKPSGERRRKKVTEDPVDLLYRTTPIPAAPMTPWYFGLPDHTTEQTPPPAPEIPSVPETRANVRFSIQKKQDDDIVMVDAGGPSEYPPVKRRSDSIAKKAGLGGMFGGLLSKAKPENKRRSTAATDDEGARGLRREDRKVKRSAKAHSDGDDLDEDREARRAARRARRAEREAAERQADQDARQVKEDERRERRRRQDEEAEEARRQEKEARRAARRAQREAEREKEEADRVAAEAKDAERAERRKLRREQRYDEAPTPETRERRRRSRVEGEDDDARRLRREERRMRRQTVHETEPVVDSYFDSRNAGAEDPVYSTATKESSEIRSRRRDQEQRPGWPHSGTSSWVKEASDHALPPPIAATVIEEKVDDNDDAADREIRRQLRKARRARRGDEVEGDEERRKRRAGRRADGGGGWDDEGVRRDRDRGLAFAVPEVPSRAQSTQGRGGWWKKIPGL